LALSLPHAADRLGPATEPIDPDVSARIDVLRAILIGLIVLCHGGRWIGSDVAFAGPAVEFVLALVNRGLDCVAVPLFFAISGYLLLRKLTLSPAAYLGLLRKKFVSIGIPFLFFNAVWIGWIFTIGCIDLFGSRSFLLQAGILRKLVGIGTSPINYPLWFLRDLLILFALSPVFLVFYRRVPVAGLLALLLVWFTGALTDEYSLGGFAFAFYAGGFLARRRVNLRDTARLDKFVLPVFLAASVLVGLTPWLGLDVYGLAALKKLYQIVGVAAFWCVSRYAWIKGSRVLHAMASMSFFIFLTHEPTVSLLQARLLRLWQPAGTAWQLVAYPVAGLTAMALLYGLGRALSRLAPKVFAVLTGSPLRLRRMSISAQRKPLSQAGSVAAGLCRDEGQG